MTDWGEKSVVFDEVRSSIENKVLEKESEAQTRFDVVDRIVKEVLDWRHGQIQVEERQEHGVRGYVDYILRSGDITIVIEAKKIGASFPSPTRAGKLRLNSTVLSGGDIAKAIAQAKEYAKSKIAQITVVTNGRCWCFFKTGDAINDPSTYARLLFPFDTDLDAEDLYRFFSNENVTNHGLDFFNDEPSTISDNRLLTVVRDSEVRVGRNNVADYIAPALDSALHSEAVINDPEFLRSVFVHTTARSKYDTTLSMHLVDLKPVSVLPAYRVRTDKGGGELEKLVKYGRPTSAPPAILLIADVGIGKSMYLKHFQLVSGKKLLEDRRAHWVYVDFESMGSGGNIRDFLYGRLRDYLLDSKKKIKTDFANAIEPAYAGEIEGLREGPYALAAKDKAVFEKIITDHIQKDFDNVEPYVEKVFRYVNQNQLCVLVLDNTDLYENEELEKQVLSEGLALAKKLFCHVIISIRSTTYVKHKNDAVFDAFELKKLWLDPPPFKEVLARRFTLAGLVLKGQKADIPFSGGVTLKVPDLSVLFEVAQKSLLSGRAANFIESFAGLNIRKGLSLVINFLNSGHVHADRALQTYLSGEDYTFPFQEVFKGAILGQWKYFKELRCDCINLFDSKLHSKKLRLLRLCLLAHLYANAKAEETAQVEVLKCVSIFSKLGANSDQITQVLTDLLKYGLIKQTDAAELTKDSVVFITKTGGYYFLELSCRMVYVETCMYDTVIDDIKIWHELSALTQLIESEGDIEKRMGLRRKRSDTFIKHISEIEKDNMLALGSDSHQPHVDRVAMAVGEEFDIALRSIARSRRAHR